MQKRIIVSLLVVVLLVSTLGLAGCGPQNGADQGDSEEKVSKSQQRHAVMGTSQIAGTCYPACAKIGAIVMEHTDSLITVRSTGGSIENMRLMQSGEIGMGVCSSSVLPQVYEGTGDWEGNPYKEITFVAGLFPQVLQAVVRKSSPINTIEDVRGKVMSAGAPGSGDLIDWELMLKYHDVSLDELDWRPLTSTERAIGFKDGNVDIIAYASACPNGTILEASSQVDIRLLAVEGEERDKILAELPAYAPYTVPANTYNGQDEDVDTVINITNIMADESVDEDLVYDYVKSIYENLEDIHPIHPMAKEIRLETALYGRGDVPIHPGAERYYKEVGIL